MRKRQKNPGYGTSKPSATVLHSKDVKSSTSPPNSMRFRKLLSWLASSTILASLAGAAYEYQKGYLHITFNRQLDNGAELEIFNHWPSSRVISEFRVVAEGEFKYHLTEGAVGKIDEKGGIELARYPSEFRRSPAAEYTEINGNEISAQNSIKFRLPPFTNVPILKLDAGLVRLEVNSAPTLAPLKIYERLLASFGMSQSTTVYRFLIQDGAWTQIALDTQIDLHDAVCREQFLNPKLQDSNETKISCQAEAEWPANDKTIGDATAEECESLSQLSHIFETVTRNKYIIGGKVQGTAMRRDGSGRPLILYVYVVENTRIICESGRITYFSDSMEQIRTFTKFVKK